MKQPLCSVFWEAEGNLEHCVWGGKEDRPLTGQNDILTPKALMTSRWLYFSWLYFSHFS